MREQHTLSRRGQTPFPHGIVIVQSSCKQTYLGDADEIGTMMVSEWYAMYGHVNEGMVYWCGYEKGEDTAKFWTWFTRFVAEHRTTHVYSWQAREVMAAMGLWERIADKELFLRMYDPHNVRNADAKGIRHTQGYVILEGPPTVVAFSGKSTLGKITWLDPQNYGIRSIRPYVDLSVIGDDWLDGFDGETWLDNTHVKHLAFAVSEFIESYYLAIRLLDLGGPEHTAATQAMTAFRSHYMKHRIEIHDSVDVLKMERAALYGGRCECNFIGDLHTEDPSQQPGWERSDSPCVRYGVGKLYHLDVNAMYPFVAGSNNLPIRLQGVCGRTDVYTLLAACKAVGVIAEVQILTPLPVVPVRIDNRTVYPVGTFDTVLCGPEILAASAAGARIKCRRMALYEMAPIYHGMVERLWNARCTYAEQGDEKMRQVVKAVLNASFGKWAQLARRWTPVPHILPIRPYTQWFEVDANGDLVQYRAIGWNVDRMETLQEEQSDTFPAITAYINSHGRAYLWKLMQIAGDGNVYYVDTDALIVNQLGFDALYAAGKMGMTQIGMLKLEDMPKHLRIHGRQSYEMDGVLTISGASGKTLKSGDAFIEQLVAPPIGYYLTKHNGDGTVGEAPGTERRIARVRVTRSYNTGDVQEDGTVKPIRFGG